MAPWGCDVGRVLQPVGWPKPINILGNGRSEVIVDVVENRWTPSQSVVVERLRIYPSTVLQYWMMYIYR
jgi:hypothetical protein